MKLTKYHQFIIDGKYNADLSAVECLHFMDKADKAGGAVKTFMVAPIIESCTFQDDLGS